MWLQMNTCKMPSKRDTPKKIILTIMVIIMIKENKTSRRKKSIKKWIDKIITIIMIIIKNLCIYIVDSYVSTV